MIRRSLVVAACFAILLGGQGLAVGSDGKAVYEGTCTACHGADGKGAIPGVPDFTAADGPLSKPDDVLKKHIIEGFQDAGSPMAMPPKGGNPGLTDQEVAAVIRYVKGTFRH